VESCLLRLNSFQLPWSLWKFKTLLTPVIAVKLDRPSLTSDCQLWVQRVKGNLHWTPKQCLCYAPLFYCSTLWMMKAHQCFCQQSWLCKTRILGEQCVFCSNYKARGTHRRTFRNPSNCVLLSIQVQNAYSFKIRQHIWKLTGVFAPHLHQWLQSHAVLAVTAMCLAWCHIDRQLGLHCRLPKIWASCTAHQCWLRQKNDLK